MNFAVGVVIAIGCYGLESLRFGVKSLDYIFDLYISHESDKAQEIIQAKDTIPNFYRGIVFIDINYQNYKNWGFPSITPRNELAKIISLADSAGAKIIIPDFTFEYNDNKTRANDDSLRNVLNKIAKTKKSRIIFPAEIGRDSSLKPNIFNDIIDTCSNFYYSLPTISASPYDGIVRYSKEYNFYIDSNTRKNKIMLSIPFMVTELLRDSNITKKELSAEDDKKEETSNLFSNRIRFFIVPGSDTIKKYRSGNIPAEQYFKIDNIIPEFLRDKIVIIGSSNPESEDNHLTPIGKIPGMYILGNVINTEILKLNPKEMPCYIKVLIELFVIFGASILFMLFNEFIARVISSAAIIILFAIINYIIFYNFNYLFNFILPVLGMGFHRIISSYELLIESRIRRIPKI
jgi:CHASE2 domain-containing sensor protein